jgi:hypothetical protein
MTEAARTNLIKTIGRLEERQRTAQSSISKLIQRLQEDPLNALSWSDDAFKDAARVKVYGQVLFSLRAFLNDEKQGVSPADVAKWGQEEVLRRAKYPKMSTSVPSNLAETYETAAWAELLEFLQQWCF